MLKMASDEKPPRNARAPLFNRAKKVNQNLFQINY